VRKTLRWIECHPRTMLWIAVITTLNFVLAILQTLGVT
jgi:hypothetical protein